MTDQNENSDVTVDPQLNPNANNISFNFSGEISSPDVAGNQIRLNNHLLLKSKSESVNIDSYKRVDSVNTLKKKKKKFTWAKVQNVIRKTFHSKKKHSKYKIEESEEKFRRSSEGQIISSAEYQNEEEGNSENKENRNNNKNNKASKLNGHDNTNNNNQTNENRSNSNIYHENSSNNKQFYQRKSMVTGINSQELMNSRTDVRSSIERLHPSFEIKSLLEKDTSEEFYKSICGNYYRYDSDESSESLYSDIEVELDIDRPRTHHHKKQISMSYPSVSEGQSTISISLEKRSTDIGLLFGGSPIEEEDNKETFSIVDDKVKENEESCKENCEHHSPSTDENNNDINANNKGKIIIERSDTTTTMTMAASNSISYEMNSNKKNRNSRHNSHKNRESVSLSEKTKNAEDNSSPEYLNVNKPLLHKEYSSDGDVTDHEVNSSMAVSNYGFSEREIKSLANQSKTANSSEVSFEQIVNNHESNNRSKKENTLYKHLIKNVRNQNPSEEVSNDSIINIGICNSDHNITINENSSKTDIYNIKKDFSERVNITQIGEDDDDKESLKTASIEDCTSQVLIDEEEEELDTFDDQKNSLLLNANTNLNINKNDNNTSNIPSINIDNIDEVQVIEGELNRRYEEDLDCIIEEKEKGDVINNTVKELEGGDSNVSNNTNNSVFNEIMNNSNNNNFRPMGRYLQANISVPDNLNISSNEYDKSNSYRGHKKTNSYSYNPNESNDIKNPQPSNMNALSVTGFSNISGSYSYSGNLFGTYRSDTSDKFSDKVNKYYSLKNEGKSNSLKIRNSTRDLYNTYKKSEPRSRLDRSLNSSISKRSKKPLNIQFMAKYYKDDNNGNGSEDKESTSDADISSGLTAKEFAKLAGINILYDDDEKEEMANLQKQGFTQPPPDTHQPLDLSIFIPPSRTELTRLHNTEGTPSHHQTMPSLERSGETESYRKVVQTTQPIISRTKLAEKEITTITQSTVSAKGRTFEVSYSSNTEYGDKSKSSTINNQTSKVRNSKTEPNIHNEYTRTISRNSSCESNKLAGNIKSSNSVRSTTPSVSIVHGGPSEEMCRSILEKANPVIKIERETRFFDSPMSDMDHCSNDNASIERIKLGETQTRPMNMSHLSSCFDSNSDPQRKASPIISAQIPVTSTTTNNNNSNNDNNNNSASTSLSRTTSDCNIPISDTLTDNKKINTNNNDSTNTNSDVKVITYNRPFLSNNTKVIFFKSKRNNYVNLQSTSIDGNKHRQFYKKRFEIRENRYKLNGFENKPVESVAEVNEEEEEELNDKSNRTSPTVPSNNANVSSTPDTIQSSLNKSHIMSGTSGLTTSTSNKSHTVVTMSSSSDNNQTVITTTKTTPNHHIFITTKTITPNSNGQFNGLIIDTNRSSSDSIPNSPITSTASGNLNSAYYTNINNININNINNINTKGGDDIMDTTNNSSITNDGNSSSFRNSIQSSTSVNTTVLKNNNYNDTISFGGINFNNSNENIQLNNCSKNLSSCDIPDLQFVGTPKKLRTVSVSNPNNTKLYDIPNHRISTSNFDIDFSKNNNNIVEFFPNNQKISNNSSTIVETSSSSVRPIMISTPNSIKVSNVDFGNTNIGLTNLAMIASPLSDVSNSAFSDNNLMSPVSMPNQRTTRLPTSPSLSIVSPTNTQQQSIGAGIVKHPKSLYIPQYSRNTQTYKNLNNGNISISSVTTSEETKGRFQIEKSEEKTITTIPNLSIKSNPDSVDNIPMSLVTTTPASPSTIPAAISTTKIQSKSNNYCNDSSNDVRFNKENPPGLLSNSLSNSNSGSLLTIGTPKSSRRFSININASNSSGLLKDIENSPDKRRHSMASEKHSFINNKLSHLQTIFVSSCDNILRKSNFIDHNKHDFECKKEHSSCNSFKDSNLPNDKKIINNNEDIHSSSSTPGVSKKKEIVKGRFTIIRDS
ncbi:hypothetical protein BCR32DRAFT_272256 [Anaeromyces robustus]|uniref:Uncharacterized protein n=1 Tax=Anaeromyces robustus TaxID=1754192 RepID=A0A1Y1WGF2_9FUNG|nr:hypothetical protein BCR32DRAFT_272256 [Anaeromyces robustus]|eukprot:ORX72552.1 hypothetical protein BCR32DRAFT_272256 [Anaeromyces robustus]